ncbi:PLP-dependent aminotransferase family protein [Bacillus sp. CGMCC 1.16607]|uniref:MocR-like pyridoxine biosynthesis transcription factor PdxR n=1 Tax=Bacillus sp. CGMCC 1.16607 TaxID=3351842 RepID=UPI00362B4ACF
MLLFPNLQEDIGIPQYIQLYDYIKKEIYSGTLVISTKLPSVRKLSEFLAVSTTVVEMAYNQLVLEGFIESKPRSGYFVQDFTDLQSKSVVMEESRGRNSTNKGSTFTYDFHLSLNDFSQFPYSIWKSLYQEALNSDHENNLFFGDPQGEMGLRTAISKYLQQVRGVVCTPEQIIIGAEQFLLLSILSLMLKPVYSKIAVEETSYTLLPSTFEQMGFYLSYLPMENDGVSIDGMYGSEVKIMAVSPSHSFPVGVYMSMDKRFEILRWAEKVNGMIIEDDYDGEFYYGKPYPAIQGLKVDSPVIYLGGFSQVMAPALCISYMVLPQSLMPRFLEVKNKIYFEQSSSKLHQRALELFIDRGFMERHLRKMRTLYRKKHDLLIESIKKYFGDTCKVKGLYGGFHLILQIDHVKTVEELVLIAQQEGIRVAKAFHNKDVEKKEFILGFGGIPEEKIDEGIKKLNHVWFGSSNLS